LSKELGGWDKVIEKSVFCIQNPCYAVWEWRILKDYKMLRKGDVFKILCNCNSVQIFKNNFPFKSKKLEEVMFARMIMELPVLIPLLFGNDVENTYLCKNSKNNFCVCKDFIYKKKKLKLKACFQKSIFKILFFGYPYLVSEELKSNDKKVKYIFKNQLNMKVSYFYKDKEVLTFFCKEDKVIFKKINKDYFTNHKKSLLQIF
jgi:hypothetical protein